MDKGEEILSFNLDHNGGVLGSGCKGGSGNQGGGLQVPPGFKTQANPNLSPHCHGNMRSSPPPPPPPPPEFPRRGFNSDGGNGSDDSGSAAASSRTPDLKVGNEFIPKKKRGRPKKSPTHAVGAPLIAAWTPQKKRAVGTPVPVALTPQNKTPVGTHVPVALKPQNKTPVGTHVPVTLTPQNKTPVGTHVPVTLTPQNKTSVGTHVPVTLTPQNKTPVGTHVPVTLTPQNKTPVGTHVPVTLTPQNKTPVGTHVPVTLTPQNKTSVGTHVPVTLTPQNKTSVGTHVPVTLTPQNKTATPQNDTTVGTPVPTELTPQNKTTAGTPNPTALTPENKTEKTQKNVDENPDLSKLKPPSRSGGFKTGEELHQLLKWASSVLVSGIKEAANANEMIELSSKAFMYFDSLGVDYTPVHKAVYSVIRLHCQKEALAKQKPHSAFDTKALHDQAVVEFSQAERRHAEVKTELQDAQRDFDAIIAHVQRLSEELKNANEEKAKLGAKFAAVRADDVSCDEAYSKAKSKLDLVAPKMSDAQKAIDEYERQWKETMDELNGAEEETSNVRI